MRAKGWMPQVGWIVVALGLLGCQLLPQNAPAPAEIAALQGRVDTQFLYGRGIQATFGQIADACTVSLMETTGAASVTKGSTVTLPGGFFNLTFSNRFEPEPGRTYLLEAFKGINGNAVNKDAVRLRTLVRYTAADGWRSINDSTGIMIGEASTAVCIMYGLRSLGVDASSLLGSVQIGVVESSPLPSVNNTFTPPAAWDVPAGKGKQDFHIVSDLVSRAVLGDSDPVTAVQYDPEGGVFLVKTNLDPFIDNLSDTSAGYGAPLTITGYRFETVALNNTVYFGGSTGSVAVVDVTQPNTANALHVTVPEGAPSGEVQIRNAYGLSNGIYFKVIPRVGGKVAN